MHLKEGGEETEMNFPVEDQDSIARREWEDGTPKIGLI